MWSGFKVIDSDAHHHEPMDMWDRYLEPDFRDRVPKVIGMRRNFYVYAHDDKLSPVLDAGSPIPAHHDKWMADKYGEAYDKWWSPEIRLADMDRYGWDIQVILSTNGNRIMETSIKNPQVALRWLGPTTTGAMTMPMPTRPASSSPLLCLPATPQRWFPKLGARWKDSAPSRRAIPYCPRANGCTNPNTMPCGSLPAISIFPSPYMASRAMYGPRPFARSRDTRGLSALSTISSGFRWTTW